MSLIVIGILFSIFLGWAMGANDAANSHGTAVGSGVRTLTQAIVISSVFAILGAILEGGDVIKTIGKGIVPIDEIRNRDENLAFTMVLCATFAAALWVTISTYLKLPVSITHSSVGAVGGVGVASSQAIKWTVLTKVFVSWILTPISSAIIGLILYGIFRRVIPLLIPERWIKPVVKWLLTFSACYMAFSWGANDVANCIGPMVGVGFLNIKVAAMIGSISMAFGIATWGYRVIDTIGKRICHIEPLMAFSSELACALNVHLFTRYGIPVSTTHSIVGAVYGVGLLKGYRDINLKLIRDMVFAWSMTPIIAGAISFALLKFIANL